MNSPHQLISKPDWNSGQIVQYFFKDQAMVQVTKNDALGLISTAKDLDFIVETGILKSKQNFLKVAANPKTPKTKKSDCVLECDCGFKTVSKEEFAGHIQSHIWRN